MFTPTEIIFAATNSCNLHCEHCFVSRNPQKLPIDDSKNFILSCKKNPHNTIEKIGFSGGEPFLYFDFLIEITKFAIEQDFMFDQIMTNGDWWQTETDLTEKLQLLYDAGYDGKIGVSYDKFHGQSGQRIATFISTARDIFGPDSVNIQTVISSPKETDSTLSIPEETKVYFLPQTFPSENPKAWQSKKWFKDDYCEGPGQILYIHPDGNIAPCCGFANENPQLFIGNIEDSYEKILENASENKMINICYNLGLGKYRKKLKRQLRREEKKYPGKCSDICSFCDFVCKNTI